MGFSVSFDANVRTRLFKIPTNFTTQNNNTTIPKEFYFKFYPTTLVNKIVDINLFEKLKRNILISTSLLLRNLTWFKYIRNETDKSTIVL